MTNLLTHDGAQEIVSKLEERWRGYPQVRFYVETFTTGRGESVHCIRSNLIGGLPPVASPMEDVEVRS